MNLLPLKYIIMVIDILLLIIKRCYIMMTFEEILIVLAILIIGSIFLIKFLAKQFRK